MKTLKIASIIGSQEAILRSFGTKVFEFIKNDLQNNTPITLSFEGLTNANFPFFTALIGHLYESFPNMVKKVHFDGIVDPTWQDELEEAIYFATHAQDAKLWNNASAQLSSTV